MAQTIAIQRGTTSIVHNADPTTIYTQSGGLGTRVIFSFVAFYQSSSFSYPRIVISHKSSAGGGGVIAYYYGGDGNGRTSGQLMPSQNGVGPMQFTAQGTSSFWPTTGAIWGSLQSSAGPTYPALATAATTPVQQAQSSLYSYLPSQYWIGPSDQITIAQYNNAGIDVNFAWSFTTITES